MLREFTCIVCPNGCGLEAEIEQGKLISLQGALCKRGLEYVEQELRDPQRNIASSVEVKGGALPLVSVRLTGTIPKDRIFDVMAQIKGICLTAPVLAGQVVIVDVLGLGRDVITTKHVESGKPRTET